MPGSGYYTPPFQMCTLRSSNQFTESRASGEKARGSDRRGRETWEVDERKYEQGRIESVR